MPRREPSTSASDVNTSGRGTRRGKGMPLLWGTLGGAALGCVVGLLIGSFSWIEPLGASLSLAADGLVSGAATGLVAAILVQAAGVTFRGTRRGSRRSSRR